jgi:hypothetical protein
MPNRDESISHCCNVKYIKTKSCRIIWIRSIGIMLISIRLIFKYGKIWKKKRIKMMKKKLHWQFKKSGRLQYFSTNLWNPHQVFKSRCRRKFMNRFGSQLKEQNVAVYHKIPFKWNFMVHTYAFNSRVKKSRQ